MKSRAELLRESDYMNMFTGKGKEIIKKREENEQKKALEQERRKQQEEIKKLRKNLRSGDKLQVVLPNSETYVEFFSHTSYKLSKDFKIYPCVCTRHIEPDAYDKAVDYLKRELDQMQGQEKENAEFLIRELRAKRRYMFGFWSLDGEPMIVETSGKQGDDLVDRILEIEEDDKLNYVFTLEKTGTGMDTKYKLSVERDENRKPKKVDVSKFGEFDTSLFEKMVYVKDDKWKVMDLIKLGFDVTKIGYEKTDANNNEINEVKHELKEEKVAEEKRDQTEPISEDYIGEDDLPF